MVVMKELKNIFIVCDYAFFEGGAANVAMQSVLAFANYLFYTKNRKNYGE